MSSLRTAMRADVAWCVAVFMGALAIAVVLTWPLAKTPGSVVPHDLGDPLLNTWTLWWNAVNLPLSSGWWNAPMFFPAGGVMAFSEHLLGLSLLVSPIVWITGNPVLAYNVMLLLTFALSAVAAFLLVSGLTGRRDAAVIAAALFAFAPFRLGHLSHLQVLAAYWMPIGLLGLHRFLENGGYRWLATFALAWLLQSLSNGYFALFFSVLILLWIAWHTRARTLRRLPALLVAWFVAGICLLPILLEYRDVHTAYGLVRHFGDVQSLSADVASLLQPARLSATWDGLNVFPRNEGDLFPGATAPLVIILGAGAIGIGRGLRPLLAAIRNRSATVFYPIAALAMFLFALGPTPTYFGSQFLPAGPYAVLMAVPGAAALRVPARFGMLMALCLAIGAALVFARATASWLSSRRAVLAGLVVALAIAESWTHPLPLLDPPRAWDIGAAEIDGALLVLPVINEVNDIASVYRARTHGRPLMNGYSGHVPPWYRALKDGLNTLNPAVLDEAAAAGVTQIAIVRRNDRDGTWRNFVETRATHVRDSADGLFSLFDLRRIGAPAPVAFRAARIARVTANVNPESATRMLDRDERTIWITDGPQQAGEAVTIELAAPSSIAAVDFSLGLRHEFDYPRRLVIEVSDDGQAWREVWQGETAAAAIAGALREPLRLPVRVEFEPVEATFVRLRQTSRTRAAYWSIAEISLLSR